MPDRVLSESEMAEQRSARLLREIMGTAGWIEYERLLDAQVKYREEILLTPIANLAQKSPDFAGLDYAGKMAHLESIKGAIIALKLARELPRVTIETARNALGKTENDQ